MRRSTLALLSIPGAAIIVAAASGVALPQVSPPATGAFTAAQAAAGRTLYNQTCAGCHGPNFEGSGDAPALSGGTFMLEWRTRRVSDLVAKIQQTMPPTAAGSLSEAVT